MKRLLIIAILALLPGMMLRAQEYRVESGSSRVDSTLLGRSVLSVLGSGVTVNQSAAMKSAFDSYVSANASKKVTGYRIRVYYENSQNARNRSEAIARTISGTYPGIGVYRTFESPNFKVCVGDFRTKDEALKIYHALKSSYPTAIILKETINYPR
ncbi:MAG: hypothetical protein IKG84_03020 [Bacteroidales bacterium]|nr:hypothetical protein [Fibrobacter sp.]MBR3387189.1 hypothetical protein [Bacteroidales bacterium]